MSRSLPKTAERWTRRMLRSIGEFIQDTSGKLRRMKTQDELRREYEQLLEAEDFEAAGKILDLIEPISDEAWLKILHDAPLDDEPVPEFIQERSRALDAILAKQRGLRAG